MNFTKKKSNFSSFSELSFECWTQRRFKQHSLYWSRRCRCRWSWALHDVEKKIRKNEISNKHQSFIHQSSIHWAQFLVVFIPLLLITEHPISTFTWGQYHYIVTPYHSIKQQNSSFTRSSHSTLELGKIPTFVTHKQTKKCSSQRKGIKRKAYWECVLPPCWCY